MSGTTKKKPMGGEKTEKGKQIHKQIILSEVPGPTKTNMVSILLYVDSSC